MAMCKLVKPWQQDVLEAPPAAAKEAEDEHPTDAAQDSHINADRSPEELLMELLLEAGAGLRKSRCYRCQNDLLKTYLCHPRSWILDPAANKTCAYMRHVRLFEGRQPSVTALSRATGWQSMPMA